MCVILTKRCETELEKYVVSLRVLRRDIAVEEWIILLRWSRACLRFNEPPTDTGAIDHSYTGTHTHTHIHTRTTTDTGCNQIFVPVHNELSIFCLPKSTFVWSIHSSIDGKTHVPLDITITLSSKITELALLRSIVTISVVNTQL